jgi:hypothetical protein
MSSIKKRALNILADIGCELNEIRSMLRDKLYPKPILGKETLTACGSDPYVFPPLYYSKEKKDVPPVSPGTVSPYVGLVECEVCGCLLKKETAIKGVPEIHTRKQCGEGTDTEEYIYHPYFCNVCCECDICEDYCEEEEQVETGKDSVFFGLGTPEILGNSKPFAPAVDKNSADEQLKRAQRDYFLGQAELLRAQAESVKVDTKAKKGGS